MFLSIVIPHYNLPLELLERCIASIVQQGIATEDYEIIIVDDESQEPPMWLEDTFPGVNIRLIKAKHGGPGAARNRGMDEAKGTYIDPDRIMLHTPDFGISPKQLTYSPSEVDTPHSGV